MPIPRQAWFTFAVVMFSVSLPAWTPPGAAAIDSPAIDAALEAPPSVPRFDAAEFTLRVKDPAFKNPFTDASFTGLFRAEGIPETRVTGFADSQDGSLFRLRFSPTAAGATFHYALTFKAGEAAREFTGDLRCEPSEREGPVVTDRAHPKHFIHLGSARPFYHLGYTAYHLLDPSNDEARIDATIDYCARHGFNKIRFLLAGYPRDLDRRSSADSEFGVPDPKRAPNYGAPPGQVNALPAWLGEPHRYDFARFNVAHWRRVDRAVRRLRERGIVATCIVTIEKQDLPREYGRLTAHEERLYDYAVARLAAFDNVWWDLGNEHNEYRDRDWGNTMGKHLKGADPFGRLASAHAYQDFLYPESEWADFIITQQYGDEREVHEWALKYREVRKPYVNEEYGYEWNRDKPGHEQSRDWTRRCHWSIAMAGGYATYGDWSGGISWYYMGEPGPGEAAKELKHLRAFFEALPFRELEPRDDLTSAGFCLAKPPEHYVVYLPRGGKAEIDLASAAGKELAGTWYDPRSGARRPAPALAPGKNPVAAPAPGDWVLHAHRAGARNQ